MKINAKSTLWFLARPWAWKEFAKKVRLAIIKRLCPTEKSDSWCEQRATSIEEVTVKITGDNKPLEIERANASNGRMLYNLAEFVEAKRIIETGVCEGRSSRALLESLKNRDGRLISTDIPLPESWIETGQEVTDELKKYWTLIQQPDMIALPKALEQMPEIDMCYYDSDKSYQGRMFASPLLWNALRKGGIFVSDDIEDNYAFRDFCQQIGAEPLIAENNGRYVGVIIKN